MERMQLKEICFEKINKIKRKKGKTHHKITINVIVKDY